jgi:hypothetical protein
MKETTTTKRRICSEAELPEGDAVGRRDRERSRSPA